MLEKWKSELQQGITSHWSEWPSLNTLQTVSAGEAVQTREPPPLDAWAGNCNSHQQRVPSDFENENEN